MSGPPNLDPGEQILWQGKPQQPAGFLQAFIDYLKLLAPVIVIMFLAHIPSLGTDFGMCLAITAGLVGVAALLAGLDALTDRGLECAITDKRIMIFGKTNKEILFRDLLKVRYSDKGDVGFIIFKSETASISFMGINNVQAVLQTLPPDVAEAARKSSNSMLPACISFKSVSNNDVESASGT